MKNERSRRKFAAAALALAMLLGIAPVQVPDAHTPAAISHSPSRGGTTTSGLIEFVQI